MISALISQFCGEKSRISQPKINPYGFTSRRVWPRAGAFARHWPKGLARPRIYAEIEHREGENRTVYYARIEGQDMFWEAPINDPSWWRELSDTADACERTTGDGTVYRIQWCSGIVERIRAEVVA